MIDKIHSSKSNEWYTPSHYIELVREVLGVIDLDPASCERANEMVKARAYYTKDFNGLNTSWIGNVFCNPPYGKINGKSSQEIWLHKAQEEIDSGNAENIIMLLNACVGDRWFRDVYDYPLCFCYERIKFVSPAGDRQQPTKGNVFVLLQLFEDDVKDRFCNTFRKVGRIVVNQ